MIPPRRLSGENFGNGVSYRVAVCRKRLRDSRTIVRAPLGAGGNPDCRTDFYSSATPGVANELRARQSFPRQTELADLGRHSSVAIENEVSVEAGSEANRKAEDT